ncbi:multidrug transporter [Heyndrickxia vini]|uniref:Multidrug transporter n=1 Tax=Heyndrickxia vini TaxID=1476025 RepID=A0ABX7E446_9BACI|nr:multidrug transporter [Heyndrickxia vini]QQZ10054.1 multidrug transporter [Heyndrickxia vini]
MENTKNTPSVPHSNENKKGDYGTDTSEVHSAIKETIIKNREMIRKNRELLEKDH